MEKRKKNALVIGGTGIIGIPIVAELVKHSEYDVHSISLQKADELPFPAAAHQHFLDRNSPDYGNKIHALNARIDAWDIVIDLIAFDDASAEQTYSLFKNHARHIATVSTTLVYDRRHKNENPISEDAPLAQEGDLGGYVDGKLKLEKYWQGVTDANWTLVRPYHILGAHSLIGCIPEHNRDPKLIERLKNGETLKLCNGGNIPFNYIHPKDIAEALYALIGNEKAFRQAYNLVNPDIITAKHYYAELARQLRVPLEIEAVSIAQVWEEMKGWEMTTFPHVYSMDKMKNDIGYVPSTPLEDGMRDAILHRPTIGMPILEIPIHQRMNKLPRPKKMDWLSDER